MKKKRAIVYYLWNLKRRYWRFNTQSARTIKEHMPDVTIHLIAPFYKPFIDKIKPWVDEVTFIEVLQKDRGKPWARKFEELLKLDYDQIMFLDSDTYMTESCYELFDMLEHFDLVATLEQHYTLGPDRIPESFPQLNLGMFLWNKTAEMDEVFQKTINRLHRKKAGSDQPHFRIALYNSKIRFAVVPWEYNCHYYYPGYLFSKAKILHSMSGDMVTDEKLLNKKVYEDYPPYKRVFDGERIYYLRKRFPRRNSALELVEMVTYRG